MITDLEYIFETIICFEYPVVCLFGLLGNMLAWLVFSRPNFRNTLFDVFFRAIALNDSYVICNALVDFLSYQFALNADSQAAFVCKWRMYTLYALPAATAWLYVVVALYRLLDVLYPSKGLCRNLKLTQLTIVFVIFAACTIIYLPISLEFTTYDVDESSTNVNTTATDANSTTVTDHLISSSSVSYTCNFNIKEYFFWFDLFFSTVGPFFLMTTFIVLSLPVLFKPTQSASITSNTTARTKRMRYCFVVLMLGLTFFFMNMPMCVYNLLSLSADMPDTFGKLAILIWYSNFATCFYINFLVNSKFRAELRAMIHEWVSNIGH